MERLTVTLGERSYPITIAAGLFNDPASFLPLKSGDGLCWSPTKRWRRFIWIPSALRWSSQGSTLTASFCQTASNTKAAVMDTVFTALLQKPHGRDTTLVALGGGDR